MDVLRKETSICHGFETSTYLETNFCHSVRWQVYHLHPSAYWVVGGDTDTDIWSDRSGCSFLTGYWRINRICHWCLNGCQRWLTLGVPSLSSMVTPVQSSPISMKHRRHSLIGSVPGRTNQVRCTAAASQGRRSVNRWSGVCAVAAELRLSPSGSSSTAQCTSLHPTAPTLEPAPSSKPPNLNRATRLRRLKA